MKSIAQARRDRWVATGRCPANASYTAKIAVAKGVPVGRAGTDQRNADAQISLIDRRLAGVGIKGKTKK